MNLEFFAVSNDGDDKSLRFDSEVGFAMDNGDNHTVFDMMNEQSFCLLANNKHDFMRKTTY